HLDEALLIDLHPCPFERAKPRRLDQSRHAAPAANRAYIGPLLPRPTGGGKGALKHKGEIAAVEDGGPADAFGADAPRHLLRLDEVASAELGGIKPELSCKPVDDPLACEIG